GRSGENEKGFPARFFPHVDIAPAHRFTNAGPERLGNGFLRSETGRKMARRKFHRHRILYLACGKNAVEKSFAKSVERMLNPRALHQIHAQADDTHVAIVGQALRRPNLKTATDAVALRFSKSLRFTHDNPPLPRAFRARRFAI